MLFTSTETGMQCINPLSRHHGIVMFSLNVHFRISPVKIYFNLYILPAFKDFATRYSPKIKVYWHSAHLHYVMN